MARARSAGACSRDRDCARVDVPFAAPLSVAAGDEGADDPTQLGCRRDAVLRPRRRSVHGRNPGRPAGHQRRVAATRWRGLDFFVNRSQRARRSRTTRLPAPGPAGQGHARSRGLAFQPKARWMGAYTRPNMPRKVARLHQLRAGLPARGHAAVSRCCATRASSATPRYQAGGVAEDNATKAWYRAFAKRVGNARVVIAFEPDSIGTIECLARVAPAGAQGRAALRRGRAVQAAQRHHLPGGHRVGLEERPLHRLGCCATWAFARCAGSCST